MRSLFDHFRAGLDPDEHRDAGGEADSLFFNRDLLGSVPYRGRAWPALKADEFDELETRPVAKVRTFDLSDPAQRDEYELVLHRVVNGWYAKLAQHHHWDDQAKAMHVHLEWVQLYKEAPPRLAHLAAPGAAGEVIRHDA